MASTSTYTPREEWGINSEGLLISRILGLHGYDPDEFSYDDKIRRRYFREKRKRRHECKHGEQKQIFFKDQVCRSDIETSNFLGYPKLPRIDTLERRQDVFLKYSFEQKFADEYVPTISERLKLSNAFLSVVSLTSFVPRSEKGKELRLFTCSGIVIDATRNSTTIVTSACLVCHADEDGNLEPAENLKIKVRYGYDEPCDGTLVTCCLNYNLAFIKVKERCQVRPMPMGGRDCLSDDFEVFAVGRHYLSGDIMIASGTTTSKTNPFDCAELMFSTCKITKCGIGSLLVDSIGSLIGINFYDKNDTPYLPTCLILKCWYHVRYGGKVKQPYLGWKLRAIEFSHIHKTYVKHKLTDAVAVDKVKNGSPAHLAGICDGDIVVEICGEPAIFLAECAAVLLDKKLSNWCEPKLEFKVKIVRGENIEHVRIYTRKTHSTRYRGKSRWPLPKSEWEVIPLPRKSGFPDEFQEIVFC